MRSPFPLPRALLACALLALASCAGGAATPTTFPPGIAPLEANTAQPPAATGSDEFPEAINAVQGEDDGWEFVHAQGWVHAPVAKVWQALQDPDVVVDRRRVATWEVTRNVEPEYAVSFRVHNVVHDILTIDFDSVWRQGVADGTAAEPQVVSGRASKVAGSSFISVLDDSVVAAKVDDGITRLELIRHIKSASAGAPEAEQYLRDVFASVVARVHGHDLPKY